MRSKSFLYYGGGFSAGAGELLCDCRVWGNLAEKLGGMVTSQKGYVVHNNKCSPPDLCFDCLITSLRSEERGDWSS